MQLVNQPTQDWEYLGHRINHSCLLSRITSRNAYKESPLSLSIISKLGRSKIQKAMDCLLFIINKLGESCDP